MFVIEWKQNGFSGCNMTVDSEREATEVLHFLPQGYQIHLEETL